MIGAVAATIGIVSGFFGGIIASVFMEAIFGRLAQEEVGEYDGFTE